MRSSVLLLIASLLGVLGGAALIGVWALGLGIIFDSLAVAWWAIFVYDDGVPLPQPGSVPQPDAWAVGGSVTSILDRARAAP